MEERRAYTLAQIQIPEKLVSTVYEMLCRKISDGTFTDKLPTYPDLARQLGVSLNTIRAAVKMMEGRGLVRPQRGQGTFIVNIPHPAERPQRPHEIISGALLEIQEMRTYFGYLTSKTVGDYDNTPSNDNFQAMMAVQARLGFFLTLSGPLSNFAVGRFNDGRIAGKEHLLVPMIRGSFSSELATIEDAKRDPNHPNHALFSFSQEQSKSLKP